MHANPILWADFPDPDVIRVDDCWYMVSTTMHMMPGCVILRSFDLIHWETCTHVYDVLDGTPAQRLEGDRHIYGQGMWAATIRHHAGRFFIVFVANDTHRTYLFTAADIRGPWEKRHIEGFYHDCSLLFDDDGRTYLVHGNTDIRLVELADDLSGPKPGGVDQVIIRDTEPFFLGYEGAHCYKIGGRYHVFLIHIAKGGHARRTEAWFSADAVTGPYTGGDILDDDMGWCNSGVAQGGIVDTPDGRWFGMLFQDHGAAGRMPVLVPMRWENGRPVFGIDGKVPTVIDNPSTRPDHMYAPLFGSDDFRYASDARDRVRLKDFWQWNHQPDDALWSVDGASGTLHIRTGKISPNVHHAVNTLTQRTFGPICEARVTVDGSALRIGDVAGLCLLIGTYGLVGLERTTDGYRVVMEAKSSRKSDIFENHVDGLAGERVGEPVPCGPCVTLRAVCDFREGRDTVSFAVLEGAGWKPVGSAHTLHYRLDHFMGCRFGLFVQATRNTGGTGVFSDFAYVGPEEVDAVQHM